jgi:hypothetical protein
MEMDIGMYAILKEILIEENYLCDMICRIYCRSIVVVISISLIYCL